MDVAGVELEGREPVLKHHHPKQIIIKSIHTINGVKNFPIILSILLRFKTKTNTRAKYILLNSKDEI